MKIVCDACSAKYSIADEKVRGKVFKIRCKKCRAAIVVRGTALGESQSPEENSATSSMNGESKLTASARNVETSQDAADLVWHIVVDQDQVGPMNVADVRQRFAAGDIDMESYVWREGFEDWKPLREVDVFADLVTDGPVPSTAEPATTDSYAEGGSQDSSRGVDSFAAAAGIATEAMANESGAIAQSAADGQEIAQPQEVGPSTDVALGDNLFGTGDAAEAQQPVDVSPKLTGQRNDSSVLFSLNNLAALAGDAGQSTKPAAASAKSSGVPNQNQGPEGSGLIDIRSMASAYLGDKGDTAEAGAGDELPVFTQGAFAQPASVLLPSTDSGSSNKLLYGIVVFLALVAIGLVVIIVRGPGQSGPSKVASEGAEPPSAANPTANAVNPVAEKPLAPPSNPARNPSPPSNPSQAEPDKSAVKQAVNVEDKSTQPTSRKVGKTPRKTRDRSRSKSEKKSSQKSTKDSQSSQKCLDEVSCLLADNPPSCCSKYGRRKTKARDSSKQKNSNLPESLSRSDISSGMGKVRGRVAGCGNRHSGKGKVSVYVKVAPSGKVSSVSVKSAPTSALGACVASIVKKARFPRTQNGRGFTYPFLFK